MVIIASLISFSCILLVIFLIKNNQTRKKHKELPEPPKYIDYYKLLKKILNNTLRRITLPVISKKAEIKRAFFLIILVLTMYFLFFSAFPDNDVFINVDSADTNDACTPAGEGDTTEGDCNSYGTCNGAGWQLSSGDCSGDANCASGSSCCGDDEFEFTITESSSTDAPSNYNDGVQACCDASSDCNYDGTCVSTGSASSASVPNKAYCGSSNTWYGGDYSENACNAVAGSSRYDIGGDAVSSPNDLCCGDDNNENMITETSGTDAPSPYNDGSGTTCCADSNDCVESGTDTCTGTGNAVGTIPNKAYCGSSNTWYGGDYSSTACQEITNAGTIDYNWDLDGDAVSSPNDRCCGDDNDENRMSQDFDNDGSMDEPEDSNDVACCNSANDCIDSGNCRTENSYYSSVDSDGDQDYCLGGAWVDCINNTGCSGDDICSETINDCVNPYGFIRIRSLGTTGIEESNENYTSIRSVFLELNYSKNSEGCRYINHDDSQNRPSDSDSDWTEWEPCVKTRVWVLSKDSGNKVVYYQINYSDPNQLSLFNDSIFYNYTGAGLDKTKASAATISIGDFSNDNSTIEVSWSGAYDPESDVLGIPLEYEYLIYTNESPIDILKQGTTTATSISATNSSDNGFNLAHNTKVYVNITVINSARLRTRSSTYPSGLIIDLEKPVITGSTRGSFTNGSNNENQPLPSNENLDIWATDANFTWFATDYLSQTIDAYSYVLSQNPNAEVDNIPEGSVGSFDTHTSREFSNLNSGKYYFKVKAKDGAGNWGDPYEIAFTTDVTGPSKPEVLSIDESSTYVTVDWSTSTDIDSGIDYYRVNLTYTDGSVYMNRTTDSTNYTFHNVASGDYNATVGARNNVGIWTWSNQDDSEVDSTPPEVYATPNRTVDTTESIIRAWTNEQAVCYNGSLEFSYTNTTYHEFKLYNQNYGTKKEITINCIDLAGNPQPYSFNFSIIDMTPDDILPNSATLTTYEDIITTYTFRVMDGSEIVAGISQDRFDIYINDEEIEHTIFDRGTGYYNLSFEAPSSSGTYELEIVLDETINESVTLNVNELYLAASFNDTDFVDISNTDHILYFTTNNGIVGFASNTPTDRIEIITDTNQINISHISLEKELFIFNTKDSASINSRENLLKEDVFLDKINPSFGYQIDDTYIINFILRYDNFVLQSGMGETLRQGNYNILVRNTLTNSGQKAIRFTKTDSETGRIVLQN